MDTRSSGSRSLGRALAPAGRGRLRRRRCGVLPPGRGPLSAVLWPGVVTVSQTQEVKSPKGEKRASRCSCASLPASPWVYRVDDASAEGTPATPRVPGPGWDPAWAASPQGFVCGAAGQHSDLSLVTKIAKASVSPHISLALHIIFTTPWSWAGPSEGEGLRGGNLTTRDHRGEALAG